MRIVAKSRASALAVAVLLSAPIEAWAQPTQTAAPAATAPTEPAPAAQESIEVRVENYIKQLHDDLHITPAQEAEWKRYAAVMRQNARDMQRAFMRRTQQIGSMNAVASLKSYEGLAEAHVQRLKRLIPAFEKLYAAMPAPQKKLADKVFQESAERHATPGSQQSR
jgi:periplasmic protein CpxP/Spy